MKPGARIVFISVWPVLKSLPQIGSALLLGQLLHRREVDRQVGRAVGERHARAQAARRRRSPTARCSRRCCCRPCFELRQRRVHVRRLAVDLGRAAPDRDAAIEPLRRLEALDVGDELLGQIHLRLALLDVGAVQLLDVRRLEHARHRADALEERTHLLEVLVRQHAGVLAPTRRRCPRRCPSRRTPDRRASPAARSR